MKVILSLAVITFATKVHSQMHPQLPVVHFDINEFMAQQHAHVLGRENHHEMEQNHEAFQADEPMVGSPLLGLGLLKPLGWGLHPLGIPGLRFSNFQAGHLGNLKFGNALLGAGNPMADEDAQLASRHHHHHIDSNAHEMEHQLAAMPPQHYQAEPQLAAAQQPQSFGHFWHLANPEEAQLGATPEQHFEAHQHFAMNPTQQFQEMEMPINHEHFQLGDPQMQHFDMQPMGPPMPHPMEMQQFQVDPNQMNPEVRTWWNTKGYE